MGDPVSTFHLYNKLKFCLALLPCFFLLACSPQKGSDLAANTLLYCSEGSPDTFNPQLVTSGTTIDAVSNQLYNRLVKIDPNTGKVTSDLARKVIISEDGKRYRFYLRKGVPFHQTDYFTPKRALTSEDVLFTFLRILDIGSDYHLVGGGTYPFFDSIDFANVIEQIIVVDELTIEFRLYQPQASFLANMATDFAVILSAEYGQKLAMLEQKHRLDSHPIGTGPYKFSEYNRDHFIRYLRHDEYWNGLPNLKQIVYDITSSNSHRLAKILTKECDVFGFPSATDVSYLANKADIKITKNTSMNVGFWAFNTAREPFDNPLVRKALSYAVDHQTILDAVYFNLAQPAHSIVPPSSWAYTDNKFVREYSLTKAKILLEQAGYKNGFEMDIWAMSIQRAYNPNAEKMAEILQQSLAELNISVNIVTYDWGTFGKRIARGEHDSVLLGWLADNSDPDNFYRPILSCAGAISGTNVSNWCLEEYDALVQQALLTPDQKIRAKHYLQAEQMLYDYAPLVPIAHAHRYKVHRDYVKNININPYGGIDFSNAEKSFN